jgi:hypothetical protein
MKAIPSRRSRRKNDGACLLDGLPLFDWAAQDRAAAFDGALKPSRAAGVVARRYRLPINRAALVAGLAGLGGPDCHE